MVAGDVRVIQEVVKGLLCVDFEGEPTSKVEILNSAGTGFMDWQRPHSISFKYKAQFDAAGKNTAIIGKWDPFGANCCWRFYTSGFNRLVLQRADNGSHLVTYSITGDTINTNKFQHIVMTFDGGVMVLYQDKVLKGVPTPAPYGKNGTTNINLGYIQSMTDKYGMCEIADFRIYDKVLSSTEVENLYNGWDITDGLKYCFNWKSGNFNERDKKAYATGTDCYITISEEQVCEDIKNLRVGANDNWLIAKGQAGQVNVVNIEEL